jgi:ABC-type transporter Mla subunit MlaD
MTIYPQMPDTLALNVNSQVRVADVSVGTVTYLLLPFSLSPQKGAATSVYLAS